MTAPIAARLLERLTLQARQCRAPHAFGYDKPHRPSVEAVGRQRRRRSARWRPPSRLEAPFPDKVRRHWPKSSELTGLLGVRGGVSIETFLMNSLPERENHSHLDSRSDEKRSDVLEQPAITGANRSNAAGALVTILVLQR